MRDTAELSIDLLILKFPQNDRNEQGRQKFSRFFEELPSISDKLRRNSEKIDKIINTEWVSSQVGGSSFSAKSTRL